MTLAISVELQKELRELITALFAPADLARLVADSLPESLDQLTEPGALDELPA